MDTRRKHLDKLFIKDLLIRCIVGIKPDERVNKQDIAINIILYADLSRACESDDINDTVDYVTIKKNIIKMTETSSFYLIEKLADRIARICLEDRRVKKVRVHLEKPGALRFARTVGIEIERMQEK